MKLDTSQLGLQRASAAMLKNAHQTARSTHGTPTGQPSHAELAVDRITIKTQYKANLAVLKIEDENDRGIIDLFA